METIKVLAINTSPRKGRNTEQLLDDPLMDPVYEAAANTANSLGEKSVSN